MLALGGIAAGVEVGVHKENLAALHIEHELLHAALFAVGEGFEVGVLCAFDREAGEHGVAVFAALVGDVFLEVNRHVREFCELGGQIALLRALDAAINFLQADDVDLGVEDDLRDALEIEFPVESLAVVDVVGHHAERLGR